MNSPGQQSTKAFSLVEVSLALAIVAIAFTVMIAMLPVGLRQSRAATDTTNEARILTAMTATLNSTEYLKLDDTKDLVYYFDADGGYLESTSSGSGGGASASASKYEKERVYQAKFVFSGQPTPGSSEDYDQKTVSKRAHILFGRYTPVVTKIFDSTNSTAGSEPFDIDSIKKGSAVKVMPVVVAKMDRNL